ncbi:MAG: hypothetical protein COA41_07125 [Sphingopyxis sp.]|nr:MAG: hypothetical protein COA41_07125 [Sphingopyxis sp.]
MPDTLPRIAVPDRLKVFISSTIGECATEREAARQAISGLNFEPVQFEREGARAEPPRDFYLRKLSDSHIVIGIYRSSYGWIDTEKGMTISGVEDEYRETHRLGKEFLAYVLKTAPDRDAQLNGMLDEMKSGPNVLYFFDDGEDLEERIRDDLTALVTDRVTHAQAQTLRASSAASVIESIYKGSPLRVRRTALLGGLTRATSLARIVWITGNAGAGKTALAAEWADERKAAYVSARGLDPRSALLAIARTLCVADEAELAIPVFEDARSLLLSRWKDGQNWPLVLDDPDDLDAVWSVLNECLATSGTGSVVIIGRQASAALPGEHFEVPGFSEPELTALRAIAGVQVPSAQAGDLPVSLRRTAQPKSPSQRFDELDAGSREAIGYLALSPAPLGLEDLQNLLGQTVGSAMELTDRLESLDDLIMETPAGYTFVHDLFREELTEIIGARPQLQALLINRLSKRLAQTNRAWAAFSLHRDESSALTEQLANRAVREAVFSGSTRHLVDALEYLTDYYRSRAEHGPLLSMLLSLADVRANHGKPDEAPSLLGEALSIAEEMGDVEAQRSIKILQACISLRRSSSQEALENVQELRKAAEQDSRQVEQGKLLLEEGVSFLGVNETNAAIPLFRQALKVFTALDDEYGAEVATRNLIIALAVNPDGLAESERLRVELGESEVSGPRYRAWLCNLLVPRLRREKRFTEAEAMAREAIEIGEGLGDQYLVAINLVVLGNVLREAGSLEDAITAYSSGGQKAQSIGRPDIEGRSSRLLALTENTAAEIASGSKRREHAERAEQYATHAAAILSNSFAWSEQAYALEERGDSRRILDRDHEALIDYADSISLYLKANDEGEVERLLRFFTALLGNQQDAPALIARAFGSNVDTREIGLSAAWVAAVISALDSCPRAVAPSVLGVLTRNFLPIHDDDWWFHCLVRCLLAVERDQQLISRERIGSLLLLSILGFSPHREFTNQELLTLAGLCIGQADGITIRHRPGTDLDLIIRIGTDRKVLFTVRTEAQRPEAIFVALFIGSFLDAFGDELASILFADGLADGVALDVTVFAQAAESGSLATFFEDGLIDTPVATGRITPKENEEVPIVVFARSDAMTMLVGDQNRGGELEVMLARFIEEVIHATLGKSLDDEIYSSKIKDLLMSILR